MKKIFFIIVAFCLANTTAFAWQTYDWKSGNLYNGYTLGNNSYLYGTNPRTGSHWSTYSTPNYMNGLDKNNNYWTYDRNTGFYNNYGTGTMCFGKGALRQCY